MVVGAVKLTKNTFPAVEPRLTFASVPWEETKANISDGVSDDGTVAFAVASSVNVWGKSAAWVMTKPAEE